MILDCNKIRNKSQIITIIYNDIFSEIALAYYEWGLASITVLKQNVFIEIKDAQDSKSSLDFYFHLDYIDCGCVILFAYTF